MRQLLHLIGLLAPGLAGAMLLAVALGQLLPTPGLLAYVSRTPAGETLRVYDVSHGIQTSLALTDRVRRAAWLPDGSGLLMAGYQARRGTWAVVSLWGDMRPATRAEQIGATSFPSPQWTHTLETQNDQLRLFHPQSRLLRLLGDGETFHLRDVAWSPDGSQIAIIMRADNDDYETRAVGLVDVKSGAVRVVPQPDAIYERLLWSNDGRQLAYIRSPREVYAVDVATLQRRTIVGPGNNSFVAALDWSPDGQQMAVAFGTGELALVDVQSGSARTLLARVGGETRVDWSPQSPWLAVSGGTVTNHQLRLIHANTGKIRPVGYVAAYDFMAWQPLP